MAAVERIFDILPRQLKHKPLSTCLSHKVNGEWKRYSTQEVIDIVNKVSGGLLKLGIKPDDKVAIASSNRPEWNFIDLAAQQIGAVPVPTYPTMSVENYEYICGHAEVKVAFAEDRKLFEKLTAATKNRPLEGIYTFDKLQGAAHWKEMLDESPDLEAIQKLKDAVKVDDLLTLIYTSGTTGTPKGVMLTHRNIYTNMLDVGERTQLLIETEDARVLSFLPLSHIFERTGVYTYMYLGCSVYYAESIEKIAENIKEVKPHCFDTVPRLLEKIYDKIMAKGEEAGGIKKMLLNWAVDLGLDYEPHKGTMPVWKAFQLDLARALVFKKWREALGGEIKVIFSGGAALQPRLTRVFWAAGIPICEAYGLTETSPGLTSNLVKPEDVRAGTVGTPFSHVTIKIADDGEILAKGDSIMRGYYKEPEKTAEVIDEDGWFHTGDIGTFVEGKFLKITDRKKEMFKTSGGKYIAPQMVENRLKESYFIEQTMVVGEGRKFPSAIIIPNFEAVKSWCEETNVKFTNAVDILKDEKFLKKLEAEINECNRGLGKWEQIKRFILSPELWSVETGELTPKMSLKRRVILKQFEQEIADLYDSVEKEKKAAKV